MWDFVLVTKTHHFLAGEVRSIVRDNGVGELKAAYYVLPKKLDNLFLGDFGKRHCLNPFGVSLVVIRRNCN